MKKGKEGKLKMKNDTLKNMEKIVTENKLGKCQSV